MRKARQVLRTGPATRVPASSSARLPSTRRSSPRPRTTCSAFSSPSSTSATSSCPSSTCAARASTVDCGYPALNLLIELDGIKGHAGERRTLADHRRDLHRRAEGSQVLRYAFAQFHTAHEKRLIEAELERCGVPRRTLRLAA